MPPKKVEESPYYLRSQEGDTFYVETMKEALEEFLGENGYRLMLSYDDKRVTFRRLSPWCDGQVNDRECAATITVWENK